MGGIHEDGFRIYKACLHALQKDLREDLLEQVGALETTFVVLPEGAEMRDLVIEVEPQEPSVGDIDFDLLHGPSHAWDSKQILDHRHLDESDRIVLTPVNNSVDDHKV